MTNQEKIEAKIKRILEEVGYFREEMMFVDILNCRRCVDEGRREQCVAGDFPEKNQARRRRFCEAYRIHHNIQQWMEEINILLKEESKKPMPRVNPEQLVEYFKNVTSKEASALRNEIANDNPN